MNLIATKSVKHAGVRHEPGDTFTASTRDGRILVAIGKAKAAGAGEVEAPQPAPYLKHPKTKSGPRKYKRRDMTAEQGSN